jgi:hypothetical protein
MMTNKQALVKELEKIFEHTTQQTVFRNVATSICIKDLLGYTCGGLKQAK